MSRIVIAFVILVCARDGYAESPGPEPIQVPDIRANIMKMLREGTGTTNGMEEDLFAEAERQQKEKEQPLKPVEAEKQPVESVPQPVKSAPKAVEAVPQLVEPAPQAEAPLPKPTGPSVELPVKEIVIEDLDDLKKLADELKKAKERQVGRQ